MHSFWTSSHKNMAPSSFSSSANIVASAVLLLLLTAGTSSANLSNNFYSKTCPNVFNTVKSVVKSAVAKEPRIGASILRLFFHDCFVNVIFSIHQLLSFYLLLLLGISVFKNFILVFIIYWVKISHIHDKYVYLMSFVFQRRKLLHVNKWLNFFSSLMMICPTFSVFISGIKSPSTVGWFDTSKQKRTWHHAIITY